MSPYQVRRAVLERKAVLAKTSEWVLTSKQQEAYDRKYVALKDVCPSFVLSTHGLPMTEPGTLLYPLPSG